MKSTLRVREILKSITVFKAFATAFATAVATAIGVFIGLFAVTAFAEDFNVSVSSGEATEGEEVTVTVTMSAGVTVGAYDLALTYDADILEYVSGADGGGGGSLRLYNDSEYTTSYTTTIKFTAKSAGTSKISVVKQGDVCDIDLNDLTLNATDGTVTVAAPVTASSNANLASLSLMAVREDGWSGSVTLAPEFSTDVTEYQLWLSGEFTKLSISAEAEDSNAKVSTAGTSLTAGQNNTTTITVTAEDSTVKTYTITVHVSAVEETTESTTEDNSATEAPAESTTENTENSDSTEGQTTENSSDEWNRIVTVSGKTYTVTDITEDVGLPEGFEVTAVTVHETEVAGAADQSGTLTLLYLLDDESGEYSFFIYYSESDTYAAFLSYTITQRMYVMLDIDDEFSYAGENAAESSFLELTTLSIAGGYVDAYMLKNNENIYIVRAMNWDNIIGYYYYSSEDGSLIPYFDADIQISEDTDAVQTTAAANEGSNIMTVVCFVLAVLLAALIVIVIMLAVKLNKHSDGGEDEVESENDADEEAYDESDEDKEADEAEKAEEVDEAEKIEMSAEKAAKEEADIKEIEAKIEAAAKEAQAAEAAKAEAVEEAAKAAENEAEELTAIKQSKTEENMSEQELDSAIDDILGQLFNNKN